MCARRIFSLLLALCLLVTTSGLARTLHERFEHSDEGVAARHAPGGSERHGGHGDHPNCATCTTLTAIAYGTMPTIDTPCVIVHEDVGRVPAASDSQQFCIPTCHPSAPPTGPPLA